MKTKIIRDPNALTGGADAAIAVVEEEGGTSLASCSLWMDGETGALGHFTASGEAPAALLFEAAEEQLRGAGCQSVVGPMDGNTWHSYRLVTKSDGRAPFLLEPQNPPDWPRYFRAAGWQSLARYTSSEIDLSVEAASAAIDRVARRLSSGGVTIRHLEPEDFEQELQRIYDVSIVSFQDNFLYSPISFEEFATMYQKVKPLLVPELSLLAEDRRSRPVGFVFALPEPSAPRETVVVKTLAVLPERRFAGLGSLLVERVHHAAREMGFDRAIHALQHQDNSSTKISSRHEAKVFREYTLYEKHL